MRSFMILQHYFIPQSTAWDITAWSKQALCQKLKNHQNLLKNENVSIYADIEVNYTMGNPGILIFLNSTKQEESRI